MKRLAKFAVAAISALVFAQSAYASCPYPVGTMVWRTLGGGTSYPSCFQYEVTNWVYMDAGPAGCIFQTDYCDICVDGKHCKSVWQLIPQP